MQITLFGHLNGSGTSFLSAAATDITTFGWLFTTSAEATAAATTDTALTVVANNDAIQMIIQLSRADIEPDDDLLVVRLGANWFVGLFTFW